MGIADEALRRETPYDRAARRADQLIDQMNAHLEGRPQPLGATPFDLAIWAGRAVTILTELRRHDDAATQLDRRTQ